MTTLSIDLPQARLNAIAGSLGLHAVIIAGILFFSLPSPHFPEQQIIPVSIVSVAPQEEVAKKVKKTPKIPLKKQPVTKQESFFAPADKAEAELKRMPAQQADVKPISDIAPSAGEAVPLQETTVSSELTPAVTTKPLYDADYLNNPPPEYPSVAKRRHMEGVVQLRVTVTTTGSARNVTITQSSGFSLLDNAAKKAVEKWNFIPAKRGIVGVEADILVPIEFKLE